MITTKSFKSNTPTDLFIMLQRFQPVARADLATISGLTRAAVTNSVKSLLNIGAIREIGKKSNGVGRKKIQLRVKEDFFHVIGTDLGRRHISVSLYNLAGDLLNKETKVFDDVRTLQENLKCAKETIKDMLGYARKNMIEVEGIGIGVPGPVDPDKGVVTCAPHYKDSETVDIKESIEKATGIPVFVERDANAAAIGEQLFGIAKKYDSFVYLLVVEGIGAGIVINSNLYRGVNGLAGKVGRFVFPNLDNGGVFSLEDYGSEISALTMAEESASRLKEGKLFDLLKTKKPGISDLIDAFKDGDKAALEVVERMSYYTAIAVSNIILFIDPSLVIIGGDFVEVSDGFVDSIKNKMRDILSNRSLPELVASPIYDKSIALGAATRTMIELVMRKISRR